MRELSSELVCKVQLHWTNLLCGKNVNNIKQFTSCLPSQYFNMEVDIPAQKKDIDSL